MGVPNGPILQSETTQNVAGGVATAAAGTATVLGTIRVVAPQLLTWPVTGDAAIVACVSTVVAPLLSRALAKWRARRQAKRNGWISK